ncbi:hypothetical protein [Xylocopilactobacillus apis]|uniref:DUF1963 domain-containing protein n=1 Tax=Xylocopilactobacillus apis TaxID=2932183 RepID=A0AAU9CZP6_9LACO|nr:hypothetical protein [Xylocopilactobacillus apis]BDR55736.1 hypothetical protein KIMC2_02980 [Xylocopilactobacillus apis]
MSQTNLVARISSSESSNVIGRIGGNIPQFFEDTLDDIKGYNFYLTVQNPDNSQEYITIFTPIDYENMVDNNIYPKCSVKVFTHPFSKESANNRYTAKTINRTNIVGYDKAADKEFDFITKTGSPELIQDETYYYEDLQKDNYDFLMQIDEDYYPDGVVGEYIFGYGAVYLYKNVARQSIVAGFWQFS